MSLWLLCVLLSSVIAQTEQDGHLPTVKDVRVSTENTEISERGAWVLNVAWRDEFVENTKSEKLLYDIEVHTETMEEIEWPVYNETIQLKPDPSHQYHWKWTSPFPLQCTSHSVKLRRRDQHQTGDWSALYTYKGQEISVWKTHVYPYDQHFLVGSNVTFCCILNMKDPLLSSSEFTIRISNRTYITEPVQFHPSDVGLKQLKCESGGSDVFIGYPPDDQNLTCFTRDLISVECHWELGRATHLTGLGGETKYTLNGRNCKYDQCVLHENNVTKWTLKAKNPLGEKIISYTADPLHRVWLRAPKKILHAVYERNATLRWSWDNKQYASFSMICQVDLNGQILNKTFRKKGLASIVLEDLQPSTDYTAKVQCGSSEHFYKWSDWSDFTNFTTKEDIPEELDVWMQYSEQNTYVLWKNLTKEQSHGMLTGYELTMSDSVNKTHIDHTHMCHKISSENKTRDQRISVSAKNSAGLSPPASIIIPSYPDNSINIKHINGSNGGFEMSWEKSSNSSCGYVVDWFPTYSKKTCTVKWKKVPSGHLSTRIQEEFDPGVRYTLSVYSCTVGAPHLLQRREGYAIERPPSEPVQDLEHKQIGRKLLLSWKEVPLVKQGGFILGYSVVISHSDVESQKNPINSINTTDRTVNLPLDPGTYTISVSAYTSAGGGVKKTFRITMEKNIDEMILATILGSSIAALLFITITFLCYKKRKGLKKRLYPDIPEPKLLGKWTKGMYCSHMTEGYMKCEIQEVHGLDCPVKSPDDSDFIRSRLCPSYHLYQNTSEIPVTSSCPPETSSITLDYSSSWPCAEKLTKIIENPSYNITCPESVDISQISGPTLEMQDSYLPVSNFVQNNIHDKNSVGYKPQILVD